MLNDELIGAYLDGELDEQKRALADHWLASDKGAAARLERMRRADALLREAIPRVATQPDDAIAALIAGQPDNVVQFKPRAWARQAAALAAACVLGVLLGRAVAPGTSPVAGDQMRVSAEVSRILDTLPSGQSAPIMGGSVDVAMSVQTDSGDVCRQYRTRFGDDAADAVACQDNGGWRMLVQTAAAESDGGFTPAGATSPIDAALSGLGPATALDQAQEQAMIAARWRASR